MESSERLYSGEFRFRPGLQIHQALAEDAERRGVSMNARATEILGQYYGLEETRNPLDVEDLVRTGSLPPNLRPLIQSDMRSSQPIFIGGAPASGKTTLQLAMLRDLGRRGARILLIGDAGQRRELEIQALPEQNMLTFGHLDHVTADGLRESRAALRAIVTRMNVDVVFMSEIRDWLDAIAFSDIAEACVTVVTTIHAAVRAGSFLSPIYDRFDRIIAGNPFGVKVLPIRKRNPTVWLSARCLRTSDITYTRWVSSDLEMTAAGDRKRG